MRRAAAYGPLVIAIVIATLLARPAANDFFQFWWAGHLIATGRSPYDPAAWVAAIAYGAAAGSVARNCVPPDAAACLWVYPPWTAWAFAPIGALGPDAGIALYRIALAAALGVGGIIWSRIAGARPLATGILLLAFGASAAAVRDIVTGHFEGLLLVGLALVAIGLRRSSPWPAIAGALLVALKPHVSLALVPAVTAWVTVTRSYRILVALCIVLGALGLAGFMSDPLAWPALTGRSAAKLELGSATTWGASAMVAGAAWPALAAVILAVAGACAILAWRSGAPRAEVAVAAGAALSLAIAPYAQSYDMVLLFPAIAMAFGRAHPAVLGAVAAAVILMTWSGYALELTGTPDPITGLLPAITLVGFALRSRVVARRTATLAPA